MLGETNKDLRADAEKILADMSIVYLACKKYLIKAEEKLETLHFYLAPTLQHRDALDHIMIAYSRLQSCDKNGMFGEVQISELKKAFNHEMRAFFDVADYILIRVRLYISDSLRWLSVKKIEKVWTTYSQERKEIARISDAVAKIRTERNESLMNVTHYSDELDAVFELYDKFRIDIEPHLGKGFFRKKRNLDRFIKKNF